MDQWERIRMIKEHNSVASAALALPPEARAELAEILLNSLDGDAQAAVDTAWRDEVERRIEQLDRDEVKLIPGDALMEELRNRCK
jgi:putative addiction module component (TIGR02574 family)